MQSALSIISALTMFFSQKGAILEAKETAPQLRGVEEPEMDISRSLQIGDNSNRRCTRCK